LKRFAVDYQLEIFIETGTFLGDTPWAFRNSFKEIYTIELSETLAKLALNRFAKFDHGSALRCCFGSMVFGLETILSDYCLTFSTQKVIYLAHRFRDKLPALLPLSELKYSRDERRRQRPYGILVLYRKLR